jgi:hypothetical protein
LRVSAAGFAELRAAAQLYGVSVRRAANLADVLLMPCPKCGQSARVMEQSDFEGNGAAGLVARERLKGAGDLTEDFERAAEAKWALRSESVDKRRDMLAAAATMPELACLPADFDKDPMLLNCPNGVVDLRHH